MLRDITINKEQIIKSKDKRGQDKVDTLEQLHGYSKMKKEVEDSLFLVENIENNTRNIKFLCSLQRKISTKL